MKVVIAGIAAALLATGCATTSQLDEVRAMAQKAQQTADMAAQKADAARGAVIAAVPAPRLGGVFFWVRLPSRTRRVQRAGRGACPGPQGSSCQSDLPAGDWVGAGIG